MDPGRSSSKFQLLAGYLAAFGSLASNVVSASCVQALKGAIPDFQMSATRSIGQALAYVIVGLIVTTDFKVGREYIMGLIYCGANFLIYNVGFFGATTYLPLAEVQGVVSIASIVSALIQAKLLFNIDIAKSIIIAASVCLIGILLTVQPAWLFSQTAATSNTATMSFRNISTSIENISFTLHPSTSYGQQISSNEAILAYTLCAVGGTAMGLAYGSMGAILQNVKVIPTATYSALLCFVGSVAFMFYFEDPVYAVDLSQCLLLSAHCLLSAVSSFLCISAGSFIPGPTMTILWSLEVVIMLASQYTIMHSIKPGNYNWIEVLGSIIIVLGASIPGVMGLLMHKAKTNELP